MTTKIQTENGRDYIPLPGGWEYAAQTDDQAGKLNASCGDSLWLIEPEAEMIDKMARAINTEWSRLLARIAELEVMETSLLAKVSQLSEEAAAAKVRAKELAGQVLRERERCALLCEMVGDDYAAREGRNPLSLRNDAETVAKECADRIRMGV